MATVVPLVVLFNTTAGNKTTAAATTTTSDLVVVVAAASGTNFANSATTAVSDNNSGTYTKVCDSGSAVATSPRVSIWIRDALVASGTSTTFTATQASSSGGGLFVYRVTGMTKTGLFAARGAATSFSASTGQTPAVTLWTPALTGNALIGAVVNSSAAGLTPPSTWSESSSPSMDVGYSTPTTALESAYLASGHTSATVTWGGTSGTAYRAAVVELDTSIFANQSLSLVGVG